MRKYLYYLNDTGTHAALLKIGIILTTDRANRARFLSANYHPFFLIEITGGKLGIKRSEMLLLIRYTRNHRVGRYRSDQTEAKYWGWKVTPITLRKNSYGWSFVQSDSLGLSQWRPELGVSLTELFEGNYF